MLSDTTVVRCDWVLNDPLYIKYHDEEWGRPQRDSVRLFEMLCLAGQQAGLSWKVILNKRQNYRKTFHNFDPTGISNMTHDDVEELLKNSGILRNKAKIKSVINNAKEYLRLQSEGQDFGKYIWSFVNDVPIVNNWRTVREVPTESHLSCAMAKNLKKRNFTFVGSTICYAYMQSCGLINDHIINCCARNVE